MSSSRYPDNNRYQRDRSPYRDRRPSTYGSTYPPRASDSNSRASVESGPFPPRDVPRGPKSLVDAPRGPTPGSTAPIPSGPRDGRGRGFAGRGDAAPSLRDAPPLSTTTHNPRDHNTRDHWRADRERDRERDRDRDRDFRDRRPSPPPARRSPIRDSRDFPPRDLDISRARRNSRDGPPSAGSTYSDPPLGSASSYRGSGIGRGRGGREFGGDFRGRGRPYHNDDRERHHDARDRAQDRTYRPRSRSRDAVRRDRDTRDDRDFDRRDRDDRRFERREDEPRRYDSYLGSASTSKPPMRALDTHRGSVASDSRNLPGTPTGPTTPHSAHHPAPSDRLGPPSDSYSRRSSIATEPLTTKDTRRESDRNDLLASRVEASRERYAPRASSPPAAVPAFGFSNVWRNPSLDAKPAAVAHTPKPAVSAPAAPPASTATPATATPAPAPKPSIPAGLSTVPPTGPKADRVPDRPQGDAPAQEAKPAATEPPRTDPTPRPNPVPLTSSSNASTSDHVETKSSAPSTVQAQSPPMGPAARNRVPPTGPQAALRPNTSPSFPRPQQPPYAATETSPGTIPSGPRNSLSSSTSPKSAPVNIPTGPKADRANPMAVRAPMYAPADRPPFSGPRMPMGVSPKSMQWVRPGLNRGPTVPTKREFPNDDRDRSFGAALKAPKLENNATATELQRPEQLKHSPVLTKQTLESDMPSDRLPSVSQAQSAPAKPAPIETRRQSDVSMTDASPRLDKPPISATSSAPKVLDDSDDDLDLDEEDFAESEVKYNRERALLEARRVDLSAPHLRAITPLQEIMLLSGLTLDHLPRQESKPVEEDIASPQPVQPLANSPIRELLTPKDEEPEDVTMEEKDEKPLAPATRALRLRQELSVERETTPDLSSLPYLGSGPPTPLSDPDHDRPSVPDSIMLAIRSNLQKDIVPDNNLGGVLREYAAVYKNWRLHIRDLDEEREQEDPERQLSAEPGLKATTPDVQSATAAAVADLLHPTTGRRGHFSRNASEFDIEQAIKESLKTAEEERLGKKDSEPRKSLADPEREAPIPVVLTPYEVRRRRFIDTNFQREPGQGVFVYHYEPPEDDFTEEEHKIMVQHYRDQYAKKWGKLAEILHKEAGTSRTYKDTINHYYATKWAREYKGKPRRGRGGPRKRGGGAGRGRGGATNVDRVDASGEDGQAPLALTDSGRPRRLAAPTFGSETEFDPTVSQPPARQRRQTDVDGTHEKGSRRGRGGKEKSGRKPKNQPLAAAAPAVSPMKGEQKQRPLGLKLEEDFAKRPIEEMSLVVPQNMVIEQVAVPNETPLHVGPTSGTVERARSATASRPGPSSYWSVTEQNDFQRYVAHFGTDWAAIAGHMGTKTQTMVKNQYLRLVESGNSPELAKMAAEADNKRDRGEELGPPPTPTPAVKRRYEPTIPTPRALAPIPDITLANDAPKSPPTSKMSPPQTLVSRGFPALAQAPAQSKPLVTATGLTSMAETPLAAIPSRPPQQSPPAQPPRAQLQQHLPHSQPQHKQHLHGPRAGYFSDDPPPRVENRAASQSTSMAQARTLQQQIQPQARAADPQPAQPFRGPVRQERDPQTRMDPQQERDNNQARFQPDHSRHMSQEVPYPRYQTSAAPQLLSQMRAAAGAGSPEAQPLLMQPLSKPQAPGRGQAPPELPNQVPTSISATPSLISRSVVRTPPVKEEPRHYPLSSQPPLSQAPLPQAQPLKYPHPTQLTQPSQPSAPITQPPIQNAVPPPAAKPAEPRKSNLLSLLNDTEPEEPRRKRPSDVPSLTPTPQQQAPIAPPPPVTQALPPRRDLYNDPNPTHAPYGRQPYSSQGQPASGRQIVDLTSEQPGARSLGRSDWQQRPSVYSAQSQPQQSATLNSPHVGLAQPSFLASHRSVFSQHNGPRHNPSPPPIPGYNHSPHMHSRTPSLSGPPSQQPRHGINNPPGSHNQTPGASQVLQPNPYAQVDPSGPQPSAPAGMRPSPHHTSHVGQPRDMQNRNEQQHAHNGSMTYSNPQTPNEHHSAPPHMRGSNMDHFRARDPRESRDPRDIQHDFDARNHDRDVGRELAQRADVLLREQRDTLHSRTGMPQTHQDLRYPPPPQTAERGYPTQRSQTPLSRPEHSRHPSLQHPPHTMLPDSNVFGQRPQEEQAHRFRDPYAARDDRERLMRDDQAHQARMRNDEYMNRERDMRERDARYREELMRREHSRLPPGPPGPPPPGQEQRQGPPSGPMDWTSGVPNRHNEPWRR